MERVDGLRVKGVFEFEHRNAAGVLLERRVVENLVTSAGKAAVAGLIEGDVTDYFDYLAIGTGTTAAATGDTALQTEISTGGGARAAATRSRITVNVTNDTAQFVYTWTFSASFAVTECGVFSASSGGTLLARQVFSAINVEDGSTLGMTYKVTVS